MRFALSKPTARMPIYMQHANRKRPHNPWHTKGPDAERKPNPEPRGSFTYRRAEYGRFLSVRP